MPTSTRNMEEAELYRAQRRVDDATAAAPTSTGEADGDALVLDPRENTLLQALRRLRPRAYLAVCVYVYIMQMHTHSTDLDSHPTPPTPKT